MLAPSSFSWPPVHWRWAFPAVSPRESPAEKILLAKAQSLVAHGHLELAIQTWQQVLLSDPTDREALLGIAKADMQLGKTEEAQKYAQRLRDLGDQFCGS